jgi:hypothetical protein
MFPMRTVWRRYWARMLVLETELETKEAWAARSSSLPRSWP